MNNLIAKDDLKVSALTIDVEDGIDALHECGAVNALIG